MLTCSGKASIVKLVDKETLMREREVKKAAEAERAAEKEKKKAALAEAEAQREAQRRTPPQDMFRAESDKYSQFDDKASYKVIVSVQQKM